MSVWANERVRSCGQRATIDSVVEEGKRDGAGGRDENGRTGASGER